MDRIETELDKAERLKVFVLDMLIQKTPPKKKAKRKSPAGESTNDLIFSSSVGTNDTVFPGILSRERPRLGSSG